MTTHPTTCTVGPTATTGTRCGAPAVTTFTSPTTGIVYAECAAHAVGFAPAAPVVKLGARVGVTHAGIRKVGTVVAVGRTRARVEVALYRGTKVITVPIAAITVLAVL